MTFQVPLDPREERRARNVGWATTILSGVLVALLVYLGYAAWVGSDELVHPDPSRVCRLPSALGMSYEAINYDQASDVSLAAEPNPDECVATGQPAGTDLVTEDGVRIAGWYIPAAAPIGPTGPTVVIVHGQGSNKNALLPIAAVFHPTFNVVLFDQRNHGQSFGTETTVGLTERLDLEAVVSWLGATHGPAFVAVYGQSMGGITAVSAVADGLPVQALILDSTPSSIADAAERRIASRGYPLSLPASWAVMLGTLFRTGVDITAADPILNIDDVGSVPVLILQGSEDTAIAPDAGVALQAEASGAGVAAEYQECVGATHSHVHEACADDFRDWVLGFLAP